MFEQYCSVGSMSDWQPNGSHCSSAATNDPSLLSGAILPLRIGACTLLDLAQAIAAPKREPCLNVHWTWGPESPWKKAREDRIHRRPRCLGSDRRPPRHFATHSPSSPLLSNSA